MELFEKDSPVAEGRQQHQRRAARLQVGAKPGCKALRDVARPPGAIARVLWRTPHERRIEENQVELLAAHGLEQIAVPYVDLVVQMIEQDVDQGATYRRC